MWEKARMILNELNPSLGLIISCEEALTPQPVYYDPYIKSMAINYDLFNKFCFYLKKIERTTLTNDDILRTMIFHEYEKSLELTK